MLKSVRRLGRYARWYPRLLDSETALLFATYSVPEGFVYRAAGGTFLAGTTVRVAPTNRLLLASSWRLLVPLMARYGLRISSDDDGALTAIIDEISLRISTFEEIFILNEIFAEKIYALHCVTPVHVVDIGANVGIASLFFASQKWVTGVTAFEPLTPTFRLAQHHLSMNPALAAKIFLVNSGLGATDRDISLQYSPTWKGSIGLSTPPAFVKTARDLHTETLRLRRASEVFRELLDHGDQSPLMVKMDCEGAEYEIMADLADTGLLRHISAFVIEWHDRGFQTLEQLLLCNGFWTWVVRTDERRDLGLIYAVSATNG